MPDKKGVLSQEEKDKVIAWITEKTGTEKIVCTVCHTHKWGVADHAVSLMPYGGSFWPSAGASYPLVMMVCANCAHTQLLNAVKIGVFESLEVTEAKEKAEKDKTEKANPPDSKESIAAIESPKGGGNV